MDAEDRLVFSQHNLKFLSFSEFSDMRVKEELVDFKINFGNRHIVGHRVVLAAAIPYFRKAFQSSNDEITLRELEPEILESAINFAYSGRIEINSQNVRPLFVASKLLKLSEVHDACCRYMEKRIYSDNVLDIRKFGETHDCIALVRSADQYIRHNFKSFSESSSFLNLSFLSLREIICRDYFGKEDDVLEAMLGWVEAFPSQREDMLHDLLMSLNFHQSIPDCLGKRVTNEAQVENLEASRSFENEDESKHFGLESEKQFKVKTVPRNSARDWEPITCAENTDDYGVYAVVQSKNKLVVKLLDLEDEKWVNLSVRRPTGFFFNVAACKGMIYIFPYFSKIEILNTESFKWHNLELHTDFFYGAGITVYKNTIYFIGGEGDKSDVIRSINPQLNVWLNEHKMARDIKHPGVTSMADFIYITGGYSDDNIYSASAASRYNPETKEWIEIAPMLTERRCHGCNSLNGKMYVCGGVLDLSSAEMYNPVTDQWTFISSMNNQRQNFTLVAHKNKLFALGRQTGSLKCAVDIEVYDPKFDEWKPGVPITSDNECSIYLVRADITRGYNYKRFDFDASTNASTSSNTSTTGFGSETDAIIPSFSNLSLGGEQAQNTNEIIPLSFTAAIPVGTPLFQFNKVQSTDSTQGRKIRKAVRRGVRKPD